MHGFAMRCIDQLRKELKMSNPTRTGAALAATVAIGYAACTLVFMNTLFHGLDFRKLQSGPALFNFGSFVYALVGITIWAFGLGALFGWLSGRIQR
jgi:hypothetical protein